MRDYRIYYAWKNVADQATVQYSVFRGRVLDGWEPLEAATTPKKTYTRVVDRVRQLVSETPCITTADLAARLKLTPEQIHYAVRRQCREGRMTRMLVAKGAKGQRPVYAVEMAEVVEVAPAPPVVLRRAPMMDYGSPFARRAS